MIQKEDLRQFYSSKFYWTMGVSDLEHIFPVQKSIPLAGIVADLIGDGNLQDKDKWRIDFTSKSLKELDRFGKEIHFLFGVVGKIRPCKTNRYGKTFNYGVNKKVIAIILYLCGVPRGQKVRKLF